MNHRRLALASAIILLAMAELAPVSAVEVPPLPGQLRVIAFSDGAGCTARTQLQYGMDPQEAPIGFRTEILSNCTVRVSMKDYGGSPFSSFGGSTLVSEFHSWTQFDVGGLDRHVVRVTASWPPVNPSAPCPDSTEWTASTVDEHWTYLDFVDIERPPWVAWDEPRIVEGGCTVTAHTDWAPYQRGDATSPDYPPAWRTDTSVDSSGVVTCETFPLMDSYYYPPGFLRRDDLNCIVGPVSAFVPVGEISDVIAWVVAGGETILDVPGR